MKRKQVVQDVHKSISKRLKARLLGVNLSSCYGVKKGLSENSITLMNEIQDIYAIRPFQGYRRITLDLKDKGYDVNHKRVYRLMRVMGLKALFPKKNLSKRNHAHKVHPYLLKDFPPQKPNDVWCTDITYIRTSKGFVYLTALIDVVSRYVMGYHLSPFLDTESCLNALEMAIKSGYSPKIINTDQGCQFTSQEWLYSLSLLGVQVSQDGKGRCLDNIPIERFWRTLKYEEVYLKTYETVQEARKAIAHYIHWYNHQRRHLGLNYHRPYEVMVGLENAQTWPFQLDENVDNAMRRNPRDTSKNVIHNFTSSTTTKSKQKNMKKKTKLSLNLAA